MHIFEETEVHIVIFRPLMLIELKNNYASTINSTKNLKFDFSPKTTKLNMFVSENKLIGYCAL